MKYEKSCGAAVYRFRNGTLYFLVEHMIQGHTSIPKGHVEGDETEEETAVREIREETGLEVRLDTGFRDGTAYSPCEGVYKQVVFFAAEALPGEMKNQESEVNSLEWLPYGDAVRAMTYESDKEVLRHAAAYLSGKYGREAGGKEIWREGILGVVVGDALGCPVQFEEREEVAKHPVTGMRGYGTFGLPAGSWTDDSSLTLALLDSIVRTGKPDLKDIMDNFAEWLDHGAFTPYGYAYDIGGGTMKAIEAYKRSGDPLLCGGREEWNNGNGSLMRIMPACLYCYKKGMLDDEAVRTVRAVGSLTHAHIRSNIACCLYYFMVKEILDGEGGLKDRLQKGLDRGFAVLEKEGADPENLACYGRLRDPGAFARTPAEEIRSSGYVVDTLEAVVWSLLTTGSFEEALLKVVNLGLDTDTTGAIAGGLAALYYGEEAIPKEWIKEIKKLDWIEELCDKAEQISL